MNHLPDFAAEQWMECLLAPGPVSRHLEGGLSTVENFMQLYRVCLIQEETPLGYGQLDREMINIMLNRGSPWAHGGKPAGLMNQEPIPVGYAT